MADFPTYARILRDNFSEDFDPSIITTEMERGIPTQRVSNSQVLMKIEMTVMFLNLDDVQKFESWYFNVINRIDFFNFVLPRTKQVVSARFQGGKIGKLTPVSTRYAQRSFTIEYLR